MKVLLFWIPRNLPKDMAAMLKKEKVTLEGFVGLLGGEELEDIADAQRWQYYNCYSFEQVSDYMLNGINSGEFNHNEFYFAIKTMPKRA